MKAAIFSKETHLTHLKLALVEEAMPSGASHTQQFGTPAT